MTGKVKIAGNMGMLLGLQSVLALLPGGDGRDRRRVLARRPFLRHRERGVRPGEQPSSRVDDVGFREPELAPDLDRTPAGDDLPGASRRQELDAELDRDVPPARLQHGPDRQPHRRVRERGEDPAVHQTLQVEMVRSRPRTRSPRVPATRPRAPPPPIGRTRCPAGDLGDLVISASCSSIRGPLRVRSLPRKRRLTVADGRTHNPERRDRLTGPGKGTEGEGKDAQRFLAVRCAAGPVGMVSAACSNNDDNAGSSGATGASGSSGSPAARSATRTSRWYGVRRRRPGRQVLQRRGQPPGCSRRSPTGSCARRTPISNEANAAGSDLDRERAGARRRRVSTYVVVSVSRSRQASTRSPPDYPDTSFMIVDGYATCGTACGLDKTTPATCPT